MGNAELIATPVEWLTIEQAAARLHRSPRRVQELAKDGRLKRRFVVGAGHQRIIMIHAGSLEHYVSEIEAGSPRGAPPKRPEALLAAATAKRRVVVDTNVLANLVAGTAAPRIPRPWLTLDEAEDASGLPAVILRGLILAGRLRALDVGIRKGGRFRIKRADLESLDADCLIGAARQE